MAQTEYVALRWFETPKAEANSASSASPWAGWIEAADRFKASSSAQAVRKAAEEYGPGTWVAVPARSWQPVNAEVEEQPRIVLRQAEMAGATT